MTENREYIFQIRIISSEYFFVQSVNILPRMLHQREAWITEKTSHKKKFHFMTRMMCECGTNKGLMMKKILYASAWRHKT